MNPSEKNADAVRRGYAAFNAADMETLRALFHEQATWHTPGQSPIAGDHKGREAVFAQFGRYGSLTGGSFKAKLLHVLKDDEGVVVGVHHNSAERKGRRLEVDCCIVFRFKNGLVIDAREHYYDLHAWDAFWA